MDRYGDHSVPQTTSLPRPTDSLVVSSRLPSRSAYAFGGNAGSTSILFGRQLTHLSVPPATHIVTGRSRYTGSVTPDSSSAYYGSMASVVSQPDLSVGAHPSFSIPAESTPDHRESPPLTSYQGKSEQLDSIGKNPSFSIPEGGTSSNRDSLQLLSYQGESEQFASISGNPSYTAPPSLRSQSRAPTLAAASNLSSKQALEAFTQYYEYLEGCPFEYLLAELASKQVISFDQMYELQGAREMTSREKSGIVLREVYTHLSVGNMKAYEQLKAVLKDSKAYAFHAENLEKHEAKLRASVVEQSPAANTQPKEQTPAESPEMRAIRIEFKRLVGAMDATEVCTQLVKRGLVRLGDEKERIECKETRADRNRALLNHIQMHIQAGKPNAIEDFIAALSNTRTSTCYLGDLLAETLQKCRAEEQEKRWVQQAPPVRVVPAPGAVKVKRQEVDTLPLQTLSVHPSSPSAMPAVEERRDQTKTFDLDKHDKWLDQPVTPEDIKRLAPLFAESEWKATAVFLDLPFDKYDGVGNPCEQMLVAYLNTGQPGTDTTNHMKDRATFMNFLNTVEESLYLKISKEFRKWSQEDTVSPAPQSLQTASSFSSEPSTNQLSSHKKHTVDAAEEETAKLSFLEAFSHKLKGCAICLEPFLADDDVNILECLHQFHSRCLDPLRSQTVADRVCPVCRNPSLEPLKRQYKS